MDANQNQVIDVPLLGRQRSSSAGDPGVETGELVGFDEQQQAVQTVVGWLQGHADQRGRGSDDETGLWGGHFSLLLPLRAISRL